MPAAFNNNGAATWNSACANWYNIVPAGFTISESGGSITITYDDPSADIYYTTDGSTPDNTDTEYISPFSSGVFTVKAIAYVGGSPDSDVLSVDFNYATTLVVSTSAATEVNSRSAILQGSLDDLDILSEADVYFEYGTTISYGSTTDTLTMSATGTFSARPTDLTEETEYHFRACVTDGVDTWYSADRTFTTLECPFQLTATPAITSILWDWRDMLTSTVEDFPFGWSGNIISIGTDPLCTFDYDTLEGALAAANDGDLILVWGAAWFNENWLAEERSDIYINKKIFIRGIPLRAYEPELKTNYTLQQYVFLHFSDGAEFLVENVILSMRNYHGYTMFIEGNATGIFNKTEIPKDSTWVRGIKGGGTNDGNVEFRNTTFRGVATGQPHFQDLNLSNLSITKSVFDKTIETDGCTGNFAVEDYVTTAVTGYGWEHGEFIISDQILPPAPCVS